MKRRVFTVFMIIVLLLCLMPSAAFAGGSHHGGCGDRGGHSGHDGYRGQGAHVDVRVVGTLTITSKVNGEIISTEDVDVKITAVEGTLNGSGLSFYRKSGMGDENEWRAEISGLNPDNDIVTLLCTVEGIKKEKRGRSYERHCKKAWNKNICRTGSSDNNGHIPDEIPCAD